MSIQTQVLSETRRGPMLWRKEIWMMEGNPPQEMDAVYNLDGDYVGDPKWAFELFQLDIIPEKRTPTSNVCSVGFSAKMGEWYGWSHRAMCGFKIGSKIENADHICAETMPIGFEAKTMADAKLMAQAYAAAVS